jgi:hypothetical protein
MRSSKGNSLNKSSNVSIGVRPKSSILGSRNSVPARTANFTSDFTPRTETNQVVQNPFKSSFNRKSVERPKSNGRGNVGNGLFGSSVK